MPKDRVVLTDHLVAAMLEVVARRANSQGVNNIETKVCSADDLPFDDAMFDSVSLRFGYVLFPAAAKSGGEVRPCAQAGLADLLVGMGSAREKPVDDDPHAGNRD